MDDNDLMQLIVEQSRLNSILDLFFNNNPSLIQSTQAISGLADHDAVVVYVMISGFCNCFDHARIPCAKSMIYASSSFLREHYSIHR